MRRTNHGDEPPPVVQGAAAFDVRSLEDPRADAWFGVCVRKVLHRMGVGDNGLDDLEQETMLRGITSRDRYDPSGGTVQSWLEVAAVFQVLTFRKHVKRKAMRLVLSGGPEDTGAIAVSLNPEQQVHARRSLRSLCLAMPPRLADSFRMRALGHTLAEIAEQTGLRIGGVQSQLQRAGEVRDSTMVKKDDNPKDGSNVRFGLAPLAALAASAEQSSPPSADHRTPLPRRRIHPSGRGTRSLTRPQASPPGHGAPHSAAGSSRRWRLWP